MPSTSVPPPVPPAVPIFVAATGTNPVVSPTFSLGTTAPTVNALNALSKRIDLAASYSGSGYAIAGGLVLSAGIGLTCAISNGHGLIGGAVEVYGGSAVILGASSVNWIWLTQAGTFVVQVGVTTRPAGECILLGSVTTNATVVTSIDTSGVVYLKSGMLWRMTGDIGPPADTLDPALRLLTTTALGTFFWDGYNHLPLPSAGSPRLGYVDMPYTVFQTAALTNIVNAILLPTSAVVHTVKAIVKTPFVGAGITMLTFTGGIVGTPAKYFTGLNGLVGGAGFGSTGWAESDIAAVQTVVQATSVGANLSALTSGMLRFLITFSTQG